MKIDTKLHSIALASLAVILFLILVSSAVDAQSSSHTKVYAYIPNYNDNTVSVIDTATNNVIATVPLGINAGPNGVAVNPNGKMVYVTNGGSSTVSVIDTTQNTVIATIPVGTVPWGVSVTPDGMKVYVANIYTDTVSVINTTTNQVIATVPVGNYPMAFG
jgi:YVTN family beta-propeller protein